jgi:hypothetical protein
MKAILSVGCQHSGHEQVFDLLVKAGVSKARSGRISNLGPQAFQDKLLGSQEIDFNAGLPSLQVLPGKLWNELAVDLFLPNLNQAAWGWADHKTAWLMEYWQEFDAQVRILLVYSPPEIFLGQVLSKNNQPTSAGIEEVLDYWVRWNTALLQYYYRHPERCLLLNSQRALAQPHKLLEAMGDHWQLDRLSLPVESAAARPVQQILQTYLASRMLDTDSSAGLLMQELDDCGLSMEETASESADDAWSAWHAWNCVRAGQAEIFNELGELRDAFAREQTQNRWLKQEYEVLLLELHETQSALEECHLRNQQLLTEHKSNTAGAVLHSQSIDPSGDIQLDMLAEVGGSNWYDAEKDGRWAGPTEYSMLEMPPMPSGDYVLEMDVVDAMRMDIVNTLIVEAFDQLLPVRLESTTQNPYPIVCKASLRIPSAHANLPWQLGLHFSQTVCPADSGGDDRRNLSVRFRALRLIRQS